MRRESVGCIEGRGALREGERERERGGGERTPRIATHAALTPYSPTGPAIMSRDVLLRRETSVGRMCSHDGVWAAKHQCQLRVRYTIDEKEGGEGEEE
jgi:hypothetical protein